MDQQNQQNPYPPQNGQQYQQLPQPQIIYVQQTVQPRRREREPIPDCMRPSSGLGVAIVAMVMFTLPFGIVSLLRAVKVDKYWVAGMRYEAIDQARSAKRWGVWGIILGAIGIVAGIVLTILSLVIGTSAPPPNISISESYIPNISKNAPITTKLAVTCPGVSLVLSRINCPIKQMNPQYINEYKYIIMPPN